MSGPLAVSIGADITKFQNAMKRADDLAARHAANIASNFQGAAKGIDLAFSALQAGQGLAVLGRIPQLARNAAVAFVGFAAIKAVLDETARAASAAHERLETLVKIAQQAQGAGVGTTFLQSLTGQARDLGTEAGKLVAMLDRAREAATTRIGEGDGKASSAIEDQLKRHVLAGNLARADLARYGAADSQEGRIRVVLDLLDQLRAKGATVAALNIGATMFGEDFVNKLRTGTDMIGAMRRALDGLAVGDQGRIIPPEEVARAESMRAQLSEISAKMETALVPLNRDISLWQAQQLQGWIDVKAQLADVVVLAGNLYNVLQNVGAAIGRLGSAAPFKALRDFLDSAGMIDKGEVARIERMLNGGATGDKPAVPKDADAGGTLAIRVRPKADTSRSLPSLPPAKPKAAGTETDEIQRFVDQLNKSAAALKAEADNFSKSNAEKRVAIELARAHEIATAAGKTATEAQAAAITKAATASANYRDQLADLEQAQRQAAEAAREFGRMASDALGDAILEGKSFGSIVDDLTKSLARMALQATLTGSGPLAGLFGTAPAASEGSSAVGGLAGIAMKLFSSGFAEGGHVTGPGTGTSDSIPALLSNGEFVTNAAATAKHRGLLEAINSGRVSRFATGGMVGADALARPDAGAGSGAPNVVSIAPTINLTASGGDAAQNKDLAERVGKQIEGSMRAIVIDTLMHQMRPRGLLNP